MEDALVPPLDFYNGDIAYLVLILVVMEDALVRINNK